MAVKTDTDESMAIGLIEYRLSVAKDKLVELIYGLPEQEWILESYKDDIQIQEKYVKDLEKALDILRQHHDE